MFKAHIVLTTSLLDYPKHNASLIPLVVPGHAIHPVSSRKCRCRIHKPASPSDRGIIIDEPDISQPPPAPIPVPSSRAHAPHKLGIALRSLILGVPCQHALDAHTHALDALDGTPASRSE